MGGLSPIHWLLVIAVAGIVFGGRGKLSSIMGDAAKGIRAFKDGLKDEEKPATAPPSQIAAAPPAASPVAEREELRR
jgi:sec-independent protein translocase protein TatA